MSNQDFTKPFYHCRDDENIEDFLFDFEMYAELKDWIDNRKKKVVDLHVSEKTRVWVCELIKTSNNWTDLRVTIVKVAKIKYHINKKVARLMRIKQDESDSVIGYSNRFESFAHTIKDKV
ncbi:12988_t:CDS:1 [Cetraspora pellucida]|uniref:12988_t:CDS:1 n=1 Tax=Cetraspora pellucida TaxID=1433469 RepID=A0A9N8Z4V6_9GLOM|nr:12988_t:CDS:1 [Cetraspora pellucida]